MSRGRVWAYAGAVLGAAASVGANVAHSYVPPVGAEPDWQPWVGSVISAVFWPLALLFAVEVFSRIEWPDGLRWVVLRWLGLVPLMAVVAVVSYQHMSGLLAFHDAGWFERTIGPGGVDGLMVLCSAALVARTAHVVAVSPADEPSEPGREPQSDLTAEAHGSTEAASDLNDEPLSPEPLRLAPPVSPEPGRVKCTAGCGRQVSLATYKRHKSKGCPAAAA